MGIMSVTDQETKNDLDKFLAYAKKMNLTKIAKFYVKANLHIIDNLMDNDVPLIYIYDYLKEQNQIPNQVPYKSFNRAFNQIKRTDQNSTNKGSNDPIKPTEQQKTQSDQTKSPKQSPKIVSDKNNQRTFDYNADFDPAKLYGSDFQHN